MKTGQRKVGEELKIVMSTQMGQMLKEDNIIRFIEGIKVKVI